MRSFTFLSLSLLFVACSSEETNATSPGGTEDAGSEASTTRPDSGGIVDPDDKDAGTDADEPLTEQTEQEPNNGNPATQVQAMTIPGTMIGAIDPANDVDIFRVMPAAGELWEWKVAPTGADLEPHIAVFDTAPDNLNPTVLAKAGAGQSATIQHFVLGGDGAGDAGAAWVAAIRDARNVPTASGKGGPTYGYRFTAKKLTVSPTVMNVGEKKTGTLASLSSIALYSFKLTQTTGLDVIITADRKASPSTLDSRLSIFDAAKKKSIGTNADLDNTTTDSQLGGDAIPAGTYIIVLENEGTDATDLSYEVEIKAR